MNNINIKLAQLGNQEELEKIIQKYQKIIFKISNLFFLKNGDQNDLYQEAYLGLIKAIKSYKEDKGASFNTFAILCIRRQLISAVIKSNSDKYKLLNIAEPEEQIEFKKIENLDTPETILLRIELNELLQKYAKENFSIFEKKVFFYLYQQYSYKEIAKILNESPKKIDNTIQRIRMKFKKYLSTYR